MLKELQRLKKELTLVANSGLQFLDYGFKLPEERSVQRYFAELQEPATAGKQPDSAGGRGDGEGVDDKEPAKEGAKHNVLRPLRRISDPEMMVDLETGQQETSTATYRVSLQQALELFDGTWLPAPFLKPKGAGEDGFEEGPTNWARLRVVALPAPDTNGNTHRLTIVLDTRIEDHVPQAGYLAPSPVDARNQSRFVFAANVAQIGWFLRREWVEGWLKQIFAASLKSKPRLLPTRGDGKKAECAYWAFYAVLLEGLAQLVNDTTGVAPLPTVRFLDTLSSATTYTPTDVDLILDIGNSRTCGVLIESAPREYLDLSRARVLELRDLSRPEFAYAEPFRSHCEFAKPDFGIDFWSRDSGRTNGFKWPSFVRVGPEAQRLNGKSSGAEGDTGLSSPKRYLWDERENRQPWYFNSAERDPAVQAPVVGDITPHVTNLGDLLEHAGPGARVGMQPKFSRASLFTFMVIELLMQALSQINSAAGRQQLGSPNVPRHLRHVVFTIPTATPIVERKRFERRCEAAVKLLWRTLGWDKPAKGIPPEPRIIIAYDEATCTQILYLYTEIAEKFRRAPEDFFKLLGRPSTSAGTSQLRVASLDIGGGTTDLMIITYNIDGSSSTLRPKQNFREGFRKAGDDILEAVVGQNVVPVLEAALQEAGVGDPRRLMLEFMSDARRDAMQRHKRKLFVSQVLVPAAIDMLAQYELMAETGDTRATVDFAQLFQSGVHADAAVLEYFEDIVRKAGGAAFSIRETKLTQDFESLGRSVTAVMGDILSFLGSVIYHFDCDLMLVTGRPSRLPVVRDLILSNLPIAPHRLTFMHQYQVGRWYPFAGRMGTIDDPKTTVVVGALLCTLAEMPRLEGFAVSRGALTLDETTAHYIGRMQLDDTIKEGDVIFSRRDGKFVSQMPKVKFEGPMFIGFRQLPVERWPGTPLFFLDIADLDQPGSSGAKMLPWTVTFRREVDDEERGPGHALDESFQIDSITDSNDEDVSLSRLTLRLQTLRRAESYWLDTGLVRIF